MLYWQYSYDKIDKITGKIKQEKKLRKEILVGKKLRKKSGKNWEKNNKE
jgi:hypothetical protein